MDGMAGMGRQALGEIPVRTAEKGFQEEETQGSKVQRFKVHRFMGSWVQRFIG